MQGSGEAGLPLTSCGILRQSPRVLGSNRTMCLLSSVNLGKFPNLCLHFPGCKMGVITMRIKYVNIYKAFWNTAWHSVSTLGH